MHEQIIHGVEDRRFEFGENWSQFLKVFNGNRIQRAEESLKQILKVPTLVHRTFLDIGSGSGLFSLAARRLGAQVHSFDYDPESVACTAELKRRYFRDDTNRTIEQGSVLDEPFVRSLGKYDAEVAKPEAVFDVYGERELKLVTLKTDGDRGCNDFVFQHEEGGGHS